MHRSARILVVGHACVDMVTQVSRVPGPDEKLEASKAWCGGGGPAANAAVALRRLGHEVWLACSLGDDVLGRIAAEELEREGVRLLVSPTSGTTSIAQIRAMGERRSVVWKGGTAPALEIDQPTLHVWLDGVDLLYVDGHEVEAAGALVAAAHRRALPVLGDLGTLRPSTERWLPAMVWAVTSPRYAAALAGTDDLGRQLDTLTAQATSAVGVGITLGARGGVARSGGRDFHWRARKVGVVDSTAAGDAFHAGLADAYLQGMDVQASLEWAAVLGASVCRGLGGRRFLPVDRADAQRFAAAWPQRPDPVEPTSA
jgi:sulfofructose kinase